MCEALRNKFNIPVDHTLVQTGTKWEQRKGQDTDLTMYDQMDPEGNIIAKYIERDSTSMYPPCGRSITYELVK
ncbi:hypothetical protein EV682_101307 [Iodobacter fluviatilis]|uniref:Uncharacterized protein n=1 Tax=Iodobacter fluviatilis TaxID=537 RepID=A0A377Q3Z4_9NEIS|nr:hypothetical protein EV682_101307 [Iodobacter fluviatilis]STQ89309.1 Uncharacterised protein [Iodobacter fluviatilis]